MHDHNNRIVCVSVSTCRLRSSTCATVYLLRFFLVRQVGARVSDLLFPTRSSDNSLSRLPSRSTFACFPLLIFNTFLGWIRSLYRWISSTLSGIFKFRIVLIVWSRRTYRVDLSMRKSGCLGMLIEKFCVLAKYIIRNRIIVIIEVSNYKMPLGRAQLMRVRTCGRCY